MTRINLVKIVMLLALLKSFVSTENAIPSNKTKEGRTITSMITLLFDNPSNTADFNQEGQLIVDINPREDSPTKNIETDDSPRADTTNSFKNSNEFVEYVKKFLENDRIKRNEKIQVIEKSKKEKNILDIINPRTLNIIHSDANYFHNDQELEESSIKKRVLSKVIEVIENIKKSTGWKSNAADKQEINEKKDVENNDTNYWNKEQHTKVTEANFPKQNQSSNYIIKEKGAADDVKKFLQEITLKNMNKNTTEKEHKPELIKNGTHTSWMYLTKNTINIAKKKKNSTVPKFYFKSFDDVENTFSTKFPGNDEPENNEHIFEDDLSGNDFLQIKGKSLLESIEIDSEASIERTKSEQEPNSSNETVENTTELEIKIDAVDSSNEKVDDSAEESLIVNTEPITTSGELASLQTNQVTLTNNTECENDDHLCSLKVLENILENSDTNLPNAENNFDLESIITEKPINYLVYGDKILLNENDMQPDGKKNEVELVNFESKEFQNEKSYPAENEEIYIDEDGSKIINLDKISDSDDIASIEKRPNEIYSESGSRSFSYGIRKPFIDDNNINSLSSLDFQDEKSYIPAATTGEELISLIPVIINSYRKGSLSEVESEAYQKMFNEVWPIIIEEAKRLPHQPINPIMKSLLETYNLIK